MIYETTIKIKNLLIQIEFDTNTEEFNYTIKERKNANAKTESKQSDTGNRTTERNETGTNDIEQLLNG